MNSSCDVCIIGGGPVGLSLAHELAAAGRVVTIIESGSDRLGVAGDSRNAGQAIGDRYRDLGESRARGVGGTAGIWNAMAYGRPFAKYTPLDAIDFERRECLPFSGWPFGRSDLESYYQRAQSLCGVGPFDYSLTTWHDGIGELGASDPLTRRIYQLGPASKFTQQLPDALRSSPKVSLHFDATLTALVRSADGRVGAAQWATPSGSSGHVEASCFVLATGAVENARLLLLDQASARCPRPAMDWLGRGFMEHPVDTSLELIGAARDRSLPWFTQHEGAGGVPIMARIGISERRLDSLGLRNASARLVDVERIREHEESLRSPQGRAFHSRWGRWRARLAAGARRRRDPVFRVLVDLEQAPHPGNRIVLSETAAVMGQPAAELHWRWRADDESNRQRVRALFQRELERAGVGRVRAIEPTLDPNAHHHAGTTRMSVDPITGVVDPNLRVHGETNLYVTGSSVFPTAGFANPTLTAVALSVRLAEHLDRELGGRPN